MDLFLLGPAFEAIYGRPMAYIYDITLARPGTGLIITLGLFSPVFILVAIDMVFNISNGIFFGLAFVSEIVLAPMFYALYAARQKTDSMDSTDRMIFRYKRKLRRQQADPERAETALSAYTAVNRRASVVLNKNKKR